MRQTICLVLCVLGFIPFVAYLCWFFNLQVPDSATINLSQLPENTMFVPVVYTSSDSIQMPAGSKVDAVVQYAGGGSNLKLAFFKRDSDKPGMLVLEETKSYDANELWHKSNVELGRFSLDNRIFTVYPQKSYKDPIVTCFIFAFVEFVFMALGSFFIRRRSDGTEPEPCSA